MMLRRNPERRVFAAAVLAAVAILSPGAALAAKQVKSVVQANTTELVGYDYEWDKTCTPLPRPKPRLVRPPRFGKVTFKPGGGTIQDEKASQCRGTRSNSVGVFYTPKRGYTGPDNFRIEWTYSIIAPTVDEFELTVQ